MQAPTPDIPATGSSVNTLALIDRAVQALAEARTIPEVKRTLDLARAAQEYARQAKLGREAEQYAAEIAVRAERRLGEILTATPRATGTRGQVRGATSGRGSKPLWAVPEQDSQQPTLADLGITRNQSARAQRLATVPQDVFERTIAGGKDGSAGILGVKRALLDVARAQKHEAIEQAAAAQPAASAQVYSVIYADPPWAFQNESPADRRITQQYPTMPTADICALEVPAAEDAVLCLWTTSAHLPDALQVMAAWGFAYRTNLVWVKDRQGMGWWVRNRHELLLVGSKGEMPAPLPANRPDSVVEAPRGKHSAKPMEVYELIERAYPTLPRIELFARAARQGGARWRHEA